jgi:hypothetical protein
MKSRFTTLTAIILAIVFLFSPVSGLSRQAQKTQTGKISGGIYNLQNGELLVKAGVEVIGKGITVQTGVDGDYSITLEPGTYSLRFFHEGFRDKIEENIVVKAGENTDKGAVLTPNDYKGEEVVITGGNGNDAIAVLEERKAATTISDTISRVELTNDTSSSAAGVLQRAPGISLVNDFVYVRGLGERYSNTVLNDSVLVTTEPDRKVVPMDLIPTNLLQNVKILKTFTPDQPGEFSGGLVKLDTIELPKATSLSVSFSLGFNSQTHGEDFLNYPVGNGFKNFFGFGRGSRKLPAGIPENERLLRELPPFFPGFSPEELQQIGQSFTNIWDPRPEDARPNLSWSVSGGRTFGKFGVVGALSFKNDLYSQDEIFRAFQIAGEDFIRPSNQYDYTSSATVARLGGALNLTYQFSPNHKFLFKNFLTNQASDETRTFQGFNEDRGTDFFNTRLRYTEERIYTGQFSGDHLLSWLGNTILTWRYTYARATLDEPDLRETLYERNPVTQEFVYFDQTQSLFRLFNEMRENLREPAFDLSKLFVLGSGGTRALNVKGGFTYVNRDRVFDSRRFRFVPRGLAGVDTTLRPEQLLVPNNINPDTFEIREETRNTDHYDAFQNITAGYLMGDLTWGRWRFIGGARVERSEQQVNTFEPFVVNPNNVVADLDDTDILPSIGIARAFRNDTMNLRVGFSRTVARPQFRELSPFEFTEIVGGRSSIGFAGLRRTLITNYDVRYEWFVSPGELIAVSVFHKDFDDPIETVVQAQTTLINSYRNADKARNTGLEIEFRKNLGTMWSTLQNASVTANYTYVRSRVNIGEENRVLLTNDERPLVGQSENIFNMILNYDIPRFGTEMRALFNYTGERITEVGALGLPDFIQHGYPVLDLLVAKNFGGEKRFRFEFQAENLLNRQLDYRVDNQAQNVYRQGRTFTFGVTYRIF